MIIGYLLLLLGIPSVGYVIYLIVDWMIRNFDSSGWMLAGAVWFIICTIVSVIAEKEQ